MILLINPRATKPAHRRFPLSIMSVGAALPAHLSWDMLDGNLPGADLVAEITEKVAQGAQRGDPVRMIAMSVMPGPQLVAAVPLTRTIKARFPTIPIVWGGNFPSLYPGPVLNCPDIDWIVRGQGERSFAALAQALIAGHDARGIAGLGYRDDDGRHVLNPEQSWSGPRDLPDPPYHKIAIADYLMPTVLGQRTGVYHASIGCPFGCSFCGVISVYGRRQKVQDPDRTARHLAALVNDHGMDSLHFYDNNFFLDETYALAIARALQPLGLRWWCEARVDILTRFADSTWQALRDAGLTMIFCGAESGSDEALARMNKGTTTAQIRHVANKTRAFGIIPEFSFVFGDPVDPQGTITQTLAFIRELKAINPAMELISYFYTPTPQRQATYGNVDALEGTPVHLEEWVTPEWVAWMTHEYPRTPWMEPGLKEQVDNFELLLNSRFPSIHDRRTRNWGKIAGRLAAMRRWQRADYSDARLLRLIRRLSRTVPDDNQAYGHLRPPAAKRKARLKSV